MGMEYEAIAKHLANMGPGCAVRFQCELDQPLEGRRELEVLPHLDVLWHYDCVISRRSPSPSAGSHDPKMQQHAWLWSPRISPLLASGLLCSFSSSSDFSPVSARSPAGGSADGSNCLCGTSVDALDANAIVPASQSPARPSTLAASENSRHAAAADGISTCHLPAASDASAATHQHPRVSLQHVFDVFDEDGDGHVSINELCSIFTKLGIPKSQESIKSLLASSPRCHKNGHIDQEEFFLLYNSVCAYVEELDRDVARSCGDMEVDVDEDLRAAFRVFDLDGNGYITAEELQSVLRALGFVKAGELEACVDMIARVDDNRDGKVDFWEFKKLMGAVMKPTLILSC